MLIGDGKDAAEENGEGSGSGLRRWEPELGEFGGQVEARERDAETGGRRRESPIMQRRCWG